MKSKAKSKLVTLSLILILAITTAIGLGSFSPTSAATPGDVSKLKFAQLSAGEDFVIGLTYDGDLYGWSLNSNASDTALNTANTVITSGGNYSTETSFTKTLGGYYPKNPYKIPVTFRRNNESGIIAKDPDFTDPDLKDKIIKIATTRTTAAFITESGYIYTWGLDQADEGIDLGASGAAHAQKGLLFRNISVNTSGDDKYVPNNTFYEPWQINYKSYTFTGHGGASSGTQALPIDKGGDSDALDISGGTDNYVVKTSSKFVAWGSSYFGQLYDTNNQIGTGNKIYKIGELATTGQYENMYAGAGYIVAQDSDNKLYLKGKNYYLPAYPLANRFFADASGKKAISLPSISNASTVTDGANAFMASSTVGSATEEYLQINNAKSAGFTQIYAGATANDAIVSAPSTSLSFKDSEGASVTNNVQKSTSANKVALGNGFGYVIKNDGKVYFWGNNYNRQASTAGTNHYGAYTDIGLTGVTQVVAGQAALGKTAIGTSDLVLRSYDGGTALPALPNVNVIKVAEMDNVEAATATIAFNNSDYTDSFTDGYISAALLSDGSVTAWNEASVDYGIANSVSGRKTVIFKNGSTIVTFGNSTSNNYIAKIVQGYGNNMFALTNLGKIYHITYTNNEFTGVLIDAFYSASGEIPNWTVNNLNATFKTGYAAVNNKIQVRTAYTYGNTVLNSDIKAKDAALTSSLFEQTGGNAVNKSNSGDAFRMMVDSRRTVGVYNFDVRNASDVSISSRPFTSDTTAFSDYSKVRFYINGEEMSTAAYNKYLSMNYVYNYNTAGSNENFKNELYMEITPKQSTKGETIVMKYWVGRFDTALNFTSSSAQFYDFKEVSVNIKIENTVSTYNDNIKYLGNDESNNTAIPLLDPNNPSNNTYSLAVMDVSSGISALSTWLGGLGVVSAATIETYMLSRVAAADTGFPAASKISDGDLTYTLGTAANTYFNNKYRYIATDRDADQVLIANSGGIFGVDKHSTKKNVYRREEITLVLNISSYVSGFESNFTDYIRGDQNEYLQTFNNLYGFYGISYSGDKNSGGELTLKYEVVKIEAVESTNSVAYNGSGTGDNQINYPVFKNVIGMDTFDVSVFEEGNRSNHKVSAIPVHAQSSLRVKKEQQQNENTPIYGKNDGNVNKVNVATYKNNIAVTVGETIDRTILLSDFFVDTTNIQFAYNGNRDLTAFNDTFASKLYQMTLSSDKFIFTPREAGTFIFNLEIRRFDVSGGSINKFKLGTEDTEVIYMRFIIVSTAAQFIKNPSAVSRYTMNDTLSVDLKNRIVMTNYDLMEIIDVQVSDASPGASAASTNKIVNPSTDHITKKLNFSAVRSGTVNVRYYVRLYDGTPISDTFTIVVESISMLAKKYPIANSRNIYLDEIRTALMALNSSSDFTGFDELIINDTDENVPDGIYYQTYDADYNVWNTVASDEMATKIPFLQLADIRKSGTAEYLHIELGNVKSTSNPAKTRIVLKFRSLNNTKFFEAAIEISPANKFIQENEEDFVFQINYGEDLGDPNLDIYSPYRDASNNAVTVPLSYFWKKLPLDQQKEFEKATIGYISAADGYDQYFDLEKSSTNNAGATIIITPKYPTKLLENDRVLVSISVNTESTNYMFTFYVSVSGITIELSKEEYGKIFLITALIVLAVLLVIFIIRMSIYWRKKAQQKRIIRKNQMLIKMRDKIHNKTAAAPKDQIVRTKMKMEDPKYAKMFNEMRLTKEAESGITLDNSVVAQKAENKAKAADELDSKKKDKKKGGKKSVDELRAELEAKKMAFAQMQANGVPPSMNIDSTVGMEMDQSIMSDAPMFDSQNGYRSDLSREDVDNQIKAKLAEESFLEFETIDPDMHKN